MTVKNIERKGNETTIVVEIDKELMEKGVNAAYLKQRKNIMIPGFRKGKAPRKMIESMYGQGTAACLQCRRNHLKGGPSAMQLFL